MIFFNSSLTVSVKARFLGIILSATFERIFHVVLNLGNQLYPVHNRFSNNACPIFSLSLQDSPLIFITNRFCFNDLLLSTFPGRTGNSRSPPLSVIIKCGLKPKNHPMERFPRSAICINIFWLRSARKGATKLISEHSPNKSCLIKMVRGSDTFFSRSTKRL